MHNDRTCTERMRWLLVAVAVGSIGLGGCGGTTAVPESPASKTATPPSVELPAPEEEEPVRPTRAAVQELVDQALHSAQETTQADVIRLLGHPLRTTHRTVDNVYAAGQVDTVRTLYYPALQAQVYMRSHDAHTFLIQVRVLAPFYDTPSGLRVEMAQAEVRQQMGAPNRVEDGVWVYENVQQHAADVRLSWSDERVSAITYVFHFS